MPDSGWRRRLLRMAAGMVMGAAFMAGLIATGALAAIMTWQPAEQVSTALGGLLLMVAVITGTGAANPRTYRVLTDDGRDDPVEPVALALLRQQALATGLLGLLLLVPPAAAHAGLTGVAAAGPMVAIVALIGWQAWLHIRLLREGDELNRAVGTESGSASFLVCGLALFGWAALEKLGLLPGLDSWTLVTAMLVLSLLASTVVGIRRGLVGRLP